MKRTPTFILIFIFLLGTTEFVRGQDGAFQPASIVKAARLVVPRSAGGLTGTIRVRVSVDAEGSVGAVEQVSGPGDICPQVTRPDIAAVRSAARDAALQSKFNPSTVNGIPQPGSGWVEFELPARQSSSRPPKDSDRITLAGGENYSAAAVPDTGTPTEPPIPKTIDGGGRAEVLPTPRYSPAAKAVRASGAVQVQVLIDEDGTIFSARAISGHPLLRANAVASACEARFSPTRLSGQPVRVSGIITYNFVP